LIFLPIVFFFLIFIRLVIIFTPFDNFLNKFLKVLPEDYERVLRAVKKAEERGLEGDEAIQAAFEENVAAGH